MGKKEKKVFSHLGDNRKSGVNCTNGFFGFLGEKSPFCERKNSKVATFRCRGHRGRRNNLRDPQNVLLSA